MKPPAALVGLVVAFGGPAVLLSPADHLLGPPERLTTKLLEQFMLWVFLAIIVAIVIFWEKRTLASMWLRPLAWRSFAWGLLFAAAPTANAIAESPTGMRRWVPLRSCRPRPRWRCRFLGRPRLRMLVANSFPIRPTALPEHCALRSSIDALVRAIDGV